MLKPFFLKIILYSVVNSATQANVKIFIDQSIMWIREQEYKPIRADNKGYSIFMNEKEACINLLYLKF